MKRLVQPVSDHWREDFRCYASQWGFRCGSEIAKLIDFIREEFRAKYGCDYRLRRVGKNRFMVVPGDHSDYGVSYAVEAAQKFNTSVTRGPNDQGESQTPDEQPEGKDIMKIERTATVFVVVVSMLLLAGCGREDHPAHEIVISGGRGGTAPGEAGEQYPRVGWACPKCGSANTLSLEGPLVFPGSLVNLPCQKCGELYDMHQAINSHIEEQRRARLE